MSPRTPIPLLAATALLSLPAVASASADRNHDGLPDGWETRHHLSLKANQAKQDQDHDGLNNAGEHKRGTDPRKADSDRDGLKDGMEVKTGNNPRKRDTDGDGIPDGRENAGVIQSFTGGVLTIKLANGQTVSGAADSVSCEDENENEIENETTVSHHRRGATAKAAKNGSTTSSGGGSNTEPAQNGDRNDNGAENEVENEVENEDAAENEPARENHANCSASDLVAGAMVHQAKMSMGPAGIVFTELQIVS